MQHDLKMNYYLHFPAYSVGLAFVATINKALSQPLRGSLAQGV